MILKPNIVDETAPLKTVVLGTAVDFGGVPAYENCYDPKSKEHVLAGTFPKEVDLVREMDQVAAVFEKHGVEVYRPTNIPGLNQIFVRDIAFVIDDKFYQANVIAERAEESGGIRSLTEHIDDDHIVRFNTDIRVEGGDVMPWGEHLFIGYSEAEDFKTYKVARTNRAGLDFFTESFSDRNVKGFELNKSDTNPQENALHLDCCFQPIGTNMGVIYPGGFKNPADVTYLTKVFGRDNLIEIDQMEMYYMNSNFFSINPELVVSNASFRRLNTELRRRGIQVEEVPYDETAKMEGLLRCSTMPLIRE